MDFIVAKTSISTQNNESASPVSVALAFLFFPFTFLVLSLESATLREVYGEMRGWLDLLTIGYCGMMFVVANPRLKRLMAIIMPLSFLGEVIFCEWLDFYQYRLDFIPIYVPFGHGIVYSAGYILSEQDWVRQYQSWVKPILIGFYGAILAIVGLFFGDQLTLILGILFFAILYRKHWNPLYLIIALGVVWVELVGTHFGCWAWSPLSFGMIATANPPLGAVFFYAGGDVLVAKIDQFLRRRSERTLAPPEPL
jgi:hypothetical protein